MFNLSPEEWTAVHLSLRIALVATRGVPDGTRPDLMSAPLPVWFAVVLAFAWGVVLPVISWRRRLKKLQFRALRPVSRRYDRLLADLGELAAGLADRLARVESELEHLRRDAD